MKLVILEDGWYEMKCYFRGGGVGNVYERIIDLGIRNNLDVFMLICRVCIIKWVEFYYKRGWMCFLDVSEGW